MSIHPYTKILLGFSPKTDDKVAKKDLQERIKSVCKPCWELKYCPYGPLVEEFLLPPPTRMEAIEQMNSLRDN